MTPADFALRVARCWSTETATVYRSDDPARGQCSVTALLAHDQLGGEIAKTRVGDAWHFYNVIDGFRHDFTAGQFDRAITYDDVAATRDDALSDTSVA